MRFIKHLIYLIPILWGGIVNAQELPPIQQFTSLDYHSGNQNWAISQSEDKLIYVANNDGLLAYNGASWTLYPTPNETIMRSVKVIKNRIYTGCYMEFGFWNRNQQGILDYTSLSQKLNIQLVEDEEFWNILTIDSWVIFQSLNRIYIYNTENDQVNIIDTEEVIHKMYKVGENIFFQGLGKGIYKIENGEASLFLENEIFSNDEIVNIFPEDQGLLILTQNNGFYTYSKGILKQSKSKFNNKISSFNIYNGIQLKSGNFALGTISNGLICFSRSSGIVFQINQSNGLLNNTVLSVFEDQENNIWSGLDNGINYINCNSPLRLYSDKNGVLGSVYTTASHQGNLYLGTNQGLFYKSLSGNENFNLIDGTQGQVWYLKVINDELFCGHHKGTFLVKRNQANIISKIPGTWNIDKLESNTNLIIQGNYDGLYILEKQKGNWQLRNKLKGFNNSSRYFEIIDQQIFINHEYKGVFHLTVDKSFTTAENIRIDAHLKGANSSIQKYKGKILYASKKGVLRYDDQQQEFVRDSLLSSIYNEENYLSGRIVLTDNDEKFWIFSKNSLTAVYSNNLAKVPSIKKVPLDVNERRDVVDYENITNLENQNTYILGTSSGYITLNNNDFSINDFKVYINQIGTGADIGHGTLKSLYDISKKGSFHSDENDLQINYYVPEYYKYLKCSYQFQLVGIYDDWSDWSNETSISFENLPPGDYTFRIRGKIGGKISENIATYSFSIDRPWYYTNLMLIIYGLTILLFSIFMHNVYRHYYRKQQQKLVEENKKELDLERIRNEKEIIRIKNEQLEKDYKNKSNELAASTMSFVKQNELLIHIKEQLITIEDDTKLKPVIKVINNNLNDHGNWEFFKEAFDNADSEFFKKIKTIHPSLSPSDLKLCAYLRLNLSSKEIAPLFNISPRSVEIKRYRLRKKLNLTNNENLTEYIISL